MRFCEHCGSQIEDGTKFCPECGQKIEVKETTQQAREPEQPAYEAPAQTYAPPAQQTREDAWQTDTPPVQQPYAQPGQQSWEAPRQNTTPPVQQPYAPYGQQSQEGFRQAYNQPVQQPNTPPTQAGGGSNVPPVTPAGAPKEKKPGSGKKIALFAGIGVAVVAVIVAVVLILVLGGKDKEDDPNLGRYEGISCMVADVDLGAEGEWIELKANGKAGMCIMGQEYSAKWSLDGETFTLNEGGSIFKGTLKDGVLTLDYYSMIYTFVRDGATAPTGEGNTAKEAGYWTLLRVESDNPDDAVSKEDIELLKSLGMEIFMDLQSDGTGAFVLEEPVKVTWGQGKITIPEESETLSYTLEDELMVVEIEGDRYIFTRGQGAAPEINWSSLGGTTGGDPGAPTEPTTDDGNWWSGKWYGWIAISNGSEAYEDAIGTCDDCVATIEVYDDDTGYVKLTFTDEEALGWADVSFGPGTTEAGCMMSQEGSIFATEISYADWIVDPGASVVSELENMICIDGTAYDEDGDWYSYYIFLRPWGMTWEDVRVIDTTDMPFDDMMPLYYDDWYLPQMENGAPVPGGNSAGSTTVAPGMAIYDYESDGEIFFDYPTDQLHFDNTFGIDALENDDGSLRMTFVADWDAADRETTMQYMYSYSTYDEYQKEELYFGGYEAVRVTYIDEWGDYAAIVYIYFGDDAGKYVGIQVSISAYSRELRDSAAVQSVLGTVRLK